MRHDVLHVLATDLRRGAETFALDLHETLRASGVRSEICSVEPGDGEQRLATPVLGMTRWSLAGLWKLRRRARDAGVVVAHGSSTLLASALALLGTGVPFVYVSIGDPRYWAGTRLRRIRAGWLTRRAAAVVAIAPSARDVLVKHYQLDERRVWVIPNGRSERIYAPVDLEGRAAARAHLGVPLDADTIAVVGALSPEKRVDVAIDAVARVTGTILLIAGDGPERASLEERAEQCAPGRVRFLGATDSSVEVLAAADAVVLSSDSEGVPGVLIEAGLSGLPVVATDVGWVRDVVKADATGLLVPPGEPGLMADAVGRALDRRDKLGRNGLQHCRAEFEMAAVSAKWLELLCDVSRNRR